MSIYDDYLNDMNGRNNNSDKKKRSIYSEYQAWSRWDTTPIESKPNKFQQGVSFVSNLFKKKKEPLLAESNDNATELLRTLGNYYNELSTKPPKSKQAINIEQKIADVSAKLGPIQERDVYNPIQGFQGDTQISQAKPLTLWQKINEHVTNALTFGEGDKDMKERSAYASAILKLYGKELLNNRIRQISQNEGISEDQVRNSIEGIAKEKKTSVYEVAGLKLDKLAEKGNDPTRNSLMENVTKELGMRQGATSAELVQGAFNIAVAIGLVTSTVPTVLGIGSFVAISKIKSGLISAVKGEGFDLKKDYTLGDIFDRAGHDTKTFLNVVDFLATAKVSKGLFDKSPKIAESLTKEIITKYNLPETITIKPKDVRDVVIGKNVGIEKDILSRLKLSSKEWRKAVKKGLSIDLPAEKVVSLIDRPYWKKLKSLFGKPSESTIIARDKFGTQKVKEPIVGLIKEGKKSGVSRFENITKEIDKAKYKGLEQLSVNIKSNKEGKKVGDMFIEFSKNAQKSGQGTKLVKDIENKFIDKGIKRIEINAMNTSVGFWEKLGYKADGEVKNGLIKMNKDLSVNQVGPKIKTLGQDTAVYRGAENTQIDVTRANGITGGVSFSLDKKVADRIAKRQNGTVTNYIIDKNAKVINHSELESIFSNLKGEELVSKVKQYLKDNNIDVVRFDIAKGKQGESELRVINKDVIKLVTISKEVKPIETKISKGLEQAIREAKAKGLSAEEFVKGQPKLFHGTNKKIGFGTGAGIGKFENGIFFTDNKQIAKAFSEITPNFLIKEAGGKKRIIEASIMLDNPKIIDFGGNVAIKSFKKEINLAKQQGYDGLIIKNIIDVPTEALEKTTKPFTETIVFNSSQIKTKQQLTDLYNQVNPKIKPQAKNPLVKARKLPRSINDLMKAYQDTGRVAYRYPRKKMISLDGITMPEKEAVSKMRGVLTDIYNQAVREAKPTEVKKIETKQKEKVIAVPRTQIPVGEGKVKVSRLEARMKGVVGKATQKQIDELGLATYNEMNNKDTIAKASNYIINDLERAMQVLEGKILPPEGLNTNSIYVAMSLSKDIQNNFDIATRLASYASTAGGQNIQILSRLNKDAPVVVMGDIIRIKEKKIEKKTGKSVKEIVKEKVSKGKVRIKPPVLSDWDSLIKEASC